MSKLLILISGLLISFFGYAGTQTKSNSYQAKLDQMVAKYRAIPVTEDVAPLIALDREIVELVRNASFDEAVTVQLRPEYSEIGIEEGVGEHIPVYHYGFLWIEAHKRNPHSAFREDTLFAVAMRDSEPNDSSVDLQPLEAYLKEYPQGSLASSVYFALANHYRDLYLVVRGLANKGKGQGEMAVNCYQRLISKKPYEEQMRESRRLSIENYEKALKLSTGSAVWKEGIRTGVLEEMKSENFRWNGYVTGCGLGND
ncbi:hypothetical protein [Sideroxyarcus emersonii]|uniref:hypothetical protein n=1 Tax=Sideroxyarcus emersonii TaxID=2764705 RepID=UPI001F1D6354|nr:hypothetical protein [Sideroxyarcus emersonii]